jgi:hypothetical protein
MKTVEKTRRMTWRGWLVVLLVLAVVGTGGYLGFSLFDRLCTKLAIADFRLRPTEEGARTLAGLVDDGSATPKQVAQIVSLLFTPQVTKEQTYPLGSVLAVRVELPFEVVFQNLMIDVNEFIWAGGQSQYGTATKGAHTLRKNPHFLRLYPTPTKPGTYKMEVRYTIQLRPQRRRVWLWGPTKGIILPQRRFVDVTDSSSQKPFHEQNIVVPVEITVIDESAVDSSGNRRDRTRTSFPDDDLNFR